MEILLQKGYCPIAPLLSARNTLQSLIYIPGTTSHKLWLLSQPTFKFAGKGYKISGGIFDFNFKKRSTKLDSVNFFFYIILHLTNINSHRWLKCLLRFIHLYIMFKIKNAWKKLVLFLIYLKLFSKIWLDEYFKYNILKNFCFQFFLL